MLDFVGDASRSLVLALQHDSNRLGFGLHQPL
jgi:hypothetical protein